MSFDNQPGPAGPPDRAAQPAGTNAAAKTPPDFPPENPAVAQLVFDSARPAAVTGLRASQGEARQLLYRLGTVCVDVCMRPELGSQQMMLLGQLLDSQSPGHGIGNIPVSLLCEEVAISGNKTNSQGEFCFGFRTLHGAQLVFGLSERSTLIVPVPDTHA